MQSPPTTAGSSTSVSRDDGNDHQQNHDEQPRSQLSTTVTATPTSIEDEEWLVYCRCESAKRFATLLSCLRHAFHHPGDAVKESLTRGGGDNQHKSTLWMTPSAHRRSQASSNAVAPLTAAMQPVTVFCSPSALTFHVTGKSKQVQASVEMQSVMFSEYRVAQPSDTTVTEGWQAGGEVRIQLTVVNVCIYFERCSCAIVHMPTSNIEYCDNTL
jgi:hypothetical protein